jgi:hypothetical protein
LRSDAASVPHRAEGSRSHAIYELRRKIRLAGNALAAVFTAALVVPEVQAGLDQIRPEVAATLRDLLEQVNAAWGVLSVGLTMLPTEPFPTPLGQQRPAGPAAPQQGTQQPEATPAGGDELRAAIKALTDLDPDQQRDIAIIKFLEQFKPATPHRESEVVVDTTITGTPADPNRPQQGQPPQDAASPF